MREHLSSNAAHFRRMKARFVSYASNQYANIACHAATILLATFHRARKLKKSAQSTARTKKCEDKIKEKK